MNSVFNTYKNVVLVGQLDTDPTWVRDIYGNWSPSSSYLLLDTVSLVVSMEQLDAFEDPLARDPGVIAIYVPGHYARHEVRRYLDMEDTQYRLWNLAIQSKAMAIRDMVGYLREEDARRSDIGIDRLYKAILDGFKQECTPVRVIEMEEILLGISDTSYDITPEEAALIADSITQSVTNGYLVTESSFPAYDIMTTYLRRYADQYSAEYVADQFYSILKYRSIL